MGASGIDIVGGIACRSGVTRNGGQQQTGLNYFQDVVCDEVAVLACVDESGIGNSFKPFVVEVVKLIEILQTNRRFFRLITICHILSHVGSFSALMTLNTLNLFKFPISFMIASFQEFPC